VQGCDASVLLDPTQANPKPEKLGLPNNPSLRGYEVIDAAKSAVEKACPGTVSCADIVAFAGRDASYLLSNSKVSFHMPAGRLDGRKSLASETGRFLPGPSSNLSRLVSAFAGKGLSVEDLVVLSGAHSIGLSHCTSFVKARLSAPSDIAASLATLLRKQCPANPTTANDPMVSQDVVSPDVLDNQFYNNVLAHNVLFTSDAALLSAPDTARMVRANARFAGSWEKKFAKAMVKMAAIGVKTGRDGEIRKSCRLVN
jgi:peroxidase